MTAVPAPHPAGAARRFGRFWLQQLLARSAQTMLWHVRDDGGTEFRLAMPRAAAADRSALARWQARAQRVAKAIHPAFAPVIEIGEVECWPYIVYDLGMASTLAERLDQKALPATEAVPWAIRLLEGLAYAHDAGIAHRDLHASMVLVDAGGARLIGLGVAHGESSADDAGGELQQQRDRKSTRLNSSHHSISYAVLCLKKKKKCELTSQNMGTPVTTTRLRRLSLRT